MHINMIAMTGMILKLQAEAASRICLTESSGMHRTSVAKYIAYWHQKELIFISEWKLHGCNWIPYFRWKQFSDQTDALRPATLSDLRTIKSLKRIKRIKARQAANDAGRAAA